MINHMNFSVFLHAASSVQIHALFAVSALLIGFLQLSNKKGTTQHKVLGRVWVAMMAIICLTSFWIRTLMPNGMFWGYSPIHLLSIFVLIQITLGVYFAKVGNIVKHKRCMTYTYFGGLIIAGAFTFYPGRLLYTVFIA